MQKTSFVILTISFLSILFLLGCDSEGNTKGTPTMGYSETLSKSKENEVFQFEVVADKPICTLTKNLKFQIKNSWVENTWSRKHYIFGKAPVMRNDSSYQLIINLNIERNSLKEKENYFYFIGNNSLDTFIHYYCGYNAKIDTIKVPLYRETSPELPSKKIRKGFDFITFVKQKS